MNKSYVLFSLVLIMLLMNVSAGFSAGTINAFDVDDTLHEDAKNGDANAQFYVFSQEVWSQYRQGNFSKTVAMFLTKTPDPIFNSMTAQGFITFPSDQENLKGLTLDELTALEQVQIKTNYEFYNVSDVGEAIKNARDKQESLYDEYLEYGAIKNLYRGNIRLMWLEIISLMQLVMEGLNILMYLVGLYLMVYVIIEMIPDALIYMRDKILESAIKKRGNI